MKSLLLIGLGCFALALHTANAATITYTYDAQHRLVQASYSASQKEFFNHDAAGNVDQRVAITDAKYLESWLLYFSALDLLPGPELTGMSWLFAFNYLGQPVHSGKPPATKM